MSFKNLNELLNFMKNSNNFYSDNLIDVNQCVIIANNELNKIQKDNELHSFSTISQRMTWINGSIFEWGDYLEENNQIIDTIDKDQKVENVIFTFEDDYESYINRIDMLNDETDLIISELKLLHTALRNSTYSADNKRKKVDSIKDLFNLISLMNLIKRTLKLAKIEMKKDQNTLLNNN